MCIQKCLVRKKNDMKNWILFIDHRKYCDGVKFRRTPRVCTYIYVSVRVISKFSTICLPQQSVAVHRRSQPLRASRVSYPPPDPLTQCTKRVRVLRPPWSRSKVARRSGVVDRRFRARNRAIGSSRSHTTPCRVVSC